MILAAAIGGFTLGLLVRVGRERAAYQRGKWDGRRAERVCQRRRRAA